MKARIDFPRPGGGRLRLTFAEPRQVVAAHSPEQVIAILAEAERLAAAGCWAVGFVAYEAAPAFDPALAVRPGDGDIPLAWFALFDQPAPAPANEAGDFSCGLWRMTMPRADVLSGVETIRAGIGEGSYYQVNLTSQLTTDFAGEGAALFASLRQAQPQGFCVHIDAEVWQLASVSPELFFDWRPGDSLTTRPMKGTAPRHADGAADLAAAAYLRSSDKERAENLMIVDLLRNDLARIARLGTVRVPGLFEVEALPTAWQMTSTVQCQPRSDIGLVDVFRALFPCGSVTGAPKIAAMAAIAALEPEPRGAYCGAIGLIQPGGHATFNVGIRTVWLDRQRHRARCGVGSGITLDSDPEREYQEWLIKRRFLLRASARFELLETLRLEAGTFWLRQGHRDRLSASAEFFGFAVAAAKVEAALDEVAFHHPNGTWRVRLLADRHGQLRTECFPLEAPPADATAILAPTPIVGDEEFLCHKTTERAAYERFTPPGGVFDTLLWNSRGELTEFTRGNLVLELAGRRVTPALASGLLPGVLRAELLAKGEIIEETLPLAALTETSRLWLINSVRGWLPIRLVSP